MLTLFERLSAEQLPFTSPDAAPGAPAFGARPQETNAHTGAVLHEVCGKPAAIVQRLAGKNQLAPQPVHCAAVGDMLARMHLAGRSYERQQPNLRGLPWWNDTVPLVLPHLDNAADPPLLQARLALKRRTAQQRLTPRCHAAHPRRPVSRQRDVRRRTAA